MQDHQEHPLQTFVHQTLQGILQKVLAETKAVQTSQPRIHNSLENHQAYETKIFATSWTSKEEPPLQKKGFGSPQQAEVHATSLQNNESNQKEVQSTQRLQ